MCLCVVALAGDPLDVVRAQSRASARQPALTVAVSSPSAPGSALLVTVTSARPLAHVEGSALGRPIAFWESEWHDAWYGLVGVALDTKPGVHRAAISAIGRDGSLLSARPSVTIAAKRFETRRLKVESRFAEPPAEEAEGIARDARLLAGLFANPSPSRLWRGRFVPPVPGRATSSFGRQTVLNGRPGSRHQGTDFVAAEGVPIQSPNAGIVVMTGNLYFSGHTVVVDHGAGLFSLFAHLSRIDVVPGAEVQAGTILGLTGSTGRVTGPHLHWAVRMGEISVDPMSVIAATAASINEPKRESAPIPDPAAPGPPSRTPPR
jgi:murein DD-endopeptidase MepM/ murein hydrolase activator NlpD